MCKGNLLQSKLNEVFGELYGADNVSTIRFLFLFFGTKALLD